MPDIRNSIRGTISIHVPRARGTTAPPLIIYQQPLISIHVPREGHDQTITIPKHPQAISIHVPREGHDNQHIFDGRSVSISIHVPREGHDKTAPIALPIALDFNPRAPRGARPKDGASGKGLTISIHVPREGHDL